MHSLKRGSLGRLTWTGQIPHPTNRSLGSFVPGIGNRRELEDEDCKDGANRPIYDSRDHLSRATVTQDYARL